MKRETIPFLIVIILMQFFVSVVLAGEVDAVTQVERVIDGDTFDTASEGRVRLADVDAPESGESGYYDAKNLLIELIYDKTVYLDVDDIYQIDPYDRLVCVVYVSYNSTHYKNVNKALLIEGVAVIRNYDNEFNPLTWTLYVPKDSTTEFPSLLIIPLFVMGMLIAVIIYRRKGSSTSHKT